MKFKELKITKKTDYTIEKLIDYEEFCGIANITGEVKNEGEKVEEITVHELKHLKEEKKEITLIDVREPHEYEICKIESSKLIPLNILDNKLSELDPNQEYVIHCKMGGRSEKAVRKLKEYGFKNVKNLKGGIIEWIDQIEPELNKY